MSASPAAGAIAVTPSDGAPLPNGIARALFIGTTGNVRVGVSRGDTTGVLFKNVPSGTVLPVQAWQVFATNTTATDIVALL